MVQPTQGDEGPGPLLRSALTAKAWDAYDRMRASQEVGVLPYVVGESGLTVTGDRRSASGAAVTRPPRRAPAFGSTDAQRASGVDGSLMVELAGPRSEDRRQPAADSKRGPSGMRRLLVVDASREVTSVSVSRRSRRRLSRRSDCRWRAID